MKGGTVVISEDKNIANNNVINNTELFWANW